MNKARRTEIRGLIDRLNQITSDIEFLINDIELVRDEEQEAFDNMPESLQQGDRGQTSEEAISNLEEALSVLDDFISSDPSSMLDNATQ